MSRRLSPLLIFVVLAIVAAAPIRSYDAFWHLAAGRWIVDHHALPVADPLAVASVKTPWINGEWLYEVGAWLVESAAGDSGLALAHTLLAAAIFSVGFFAIARAGDPALAFFVTAVAAAGGLERLGVRPASLAALLIALAIVVLGSSRRLLVVVAAYVVITVLWINIHPSALLAPLLALTTVSFDRRRILLAMSSGIALLFNPFGIRAVTAPLRLTSLVGSGAFVNSEWLPSTPVVFPLFYATIIGVSILFVRFWRREWLWRALSFAAVAVLAIQHVRNQGLYFAAFPVLIAPAIPSVANRGIRNATVSAGAILLLIFYLRSDHHLATDEQRFPVAAARQLAASGLEGNIYNADQFGGYLIATFYPQRRVLTDGRNELYASYILEDAAAHADSRSWGALVRRYHVDLAVDETGGPLIRTVDSVTGRQTMMPSWVARYPRKSWAMIGRDDVAVVFARRAAFSPERLASLELR